MLIVNLDEPETERLPPTRCQQLLGLGVLFALLNLREVRNADPCLIVVSTGSTDERINYNGTSHFCRMSLNTVSYDESEILFGSPLRICCCSLTFVACSKQP